MAIEEEGYRISGLPEPVLHHILYFLPKHEAARTCTFSKSWRHIHSTRPKLVLWEGSFAGDNNAFLFRVNATLQAHLHHNLPIERLFLGFSTLNSQSIPLIENFVATLSTMRVKELSYLNTTPEDDDGDLPRPRFRSLRTRISRIFASRRMRFVHPTKSYTFF